MRPRLTKALAALTLTGVLVGGGAGVASAASGSGAPSSSTSATGSFGASGSSGAHTVDQGKANCPNGSTQNG